MEKPKPELYAVIAASVASTVGKNARIHSIKSAAGAPPEAFIWSLEGRRNIFQSHKVR